MRGEIVKYSGSMETGSVNHTTAKTLFVLPEEARMYKPVVNRRGTYRPVEVGGNGPIKTLMDIVFT